MTILLWTIGVIVWIGCGVLAWGFFQGAHKAADYRWLLPNMVQILSLAAFGPIGLATVISVDGVKHWSWTTSTLEDCWEEWIKKGYGNSPKDYQEFLDFQSRV